MTTCVLGVLPTDTSPQFFSERPAKDDRSSCLESTSQPGHLICVDGSRVCLEETTSDNVMTHLMIRHQSDISIAAPAAQFSGALPTAPSPSSTGCDLTDSSSKQRRQPAVRIDCQLARLMSLPTVWQAFKPLTPTFPWVQTP